MTNIKNARYINKEKTLIDCDILHASLGWIPTTININDRRINIENIEVSDFVETPICKGKPDAKTEIYTLYDSAMKSLESDYTQTEINTFARKSSAAHSYISNSTLCSDNDKYLLAKIDGVVNGTSPLSPTEIAAELATIDVKGWETVQKRAVKIISAEMTYDFYLAKFEQMRNIALDQLSDTEDNTAIVEQLAAAYSKFKST